MSKKEKDTEGGAKDKQELKPEDFVREIKIGWVKRKFEKIKNDFFVHGARKKKCGCLCHNDDEK